MTKMTAMTKMAPETSDEDFSTDWLTHPPGRPTGSRGGTGTTTSTTGGSSMSSSHVGDAIPRLVWNAQGLVLEDGMIVAHLLPQGRRPALFQWHSSSTATATMPTMDCQILTRQQVEESLTSHTSAVDPSSYSSHITNTIRERLEQNLHTYTVNQILPDCLLHALLEEAWGHFLEQGLSLQQHQSASSIPSSGGMGPTRPSYYASSSLSSTMTTSTMAPEYYTLQTLHQRIKVGAALAYNYYICHHPPYGSSEQESLLRRSRRTTLPPRPNPYQKGGRIALYLLEKIEAGSMGGPETTTIPSTSSTAITTKEGTQPERIQEPANEELAPTTALSSSSSQLGLSTLEVVPTTTQEPHSSSDMTNHHMSVSSTNEMAEGGKYDDNGGLTTDKQSGQQDTASDPVMKEEAN